MKTSTLHEHGFTLNWQAWCPCGHFPLVERGADGDDERQPVWSIRLPCEQERALSAVARAASLPREEFLARLLAKALRRRGGAA